MPVRERYIEIYAGMLGVLRTRPQSRVEVINDLDGRVTNWWTAVRDDWETSAGMLMSGPPYSRRLFREAGEADQTSGVRGAYYFTLRLMWGYSGLPDGGMKQSWNIPGRPDRVRTLDPALLPLEHLAARMRSVVVENLPDTEMLTRTALLDDAVIYCDPPYPSVAEAGLYRHSAVDVGAVSDLLLAQTGLVAVSGYGKEWDHLLTEGWHRVEMPGFSTINTAAGGGTERVEVLWTNYPTGRQERLDLE